MLLRIVKHDLTLTKIISVCASRIHFLTVLASLDLLVEIGGNDHFRCLASVKSSRSRSCPKSQYLKMAKVYLSIFLPILGHLKALLPVSLTHEHRLMELSS